MEHCKVRWLRKMWRGLSQEAVKYGIMLKEEYDENGLIRITENIRPIYAKLVRHYPPSFVESSISYLRHHRRVCGILTMFRCGCNGDKNQERENCYGTSCQTLICE
jgi:hypothetical protein